LNSLISINRNNTFNMAAESKLLSQTLQSITNTKMREQDRRRKTFEASKSKILESITDVSDGRKRLDLLISGYEDLSPGNKGVYFVDRDRKNTTKNTTRYLDQSYYDPSISAAMMKNFEHKLEKKLDQESQRFEFANLYYRLLAEWTDAKSKPMEQTEEQGTQLDGSFEHVPKYDLQKLKDKFASVVFTPRETDEVEIDNYLAALFEDNHAQDLLKDIRKETASFAQRLKEDTAPFHTSMLKDCIRALLGNHLLNDDAKSTLSEFVTNPIVLEEIADVLNLRFADLDNWSWQVEGGMFYEPRDQLNGKTRIMMDMEILQAIFLHYIAISWCAHLKTMFARLPQSESFWKNRGRMNTEDKARHYYFTKDYPQSKSGLMALQEETFLSTFLNSSLPSSLTDGGDPYGEDAEEGTKEARDDSKTGLGRRQTFLRQLATDVLIRRSLHGDVAVVQSDLQWYATGLPHSTLWAVLRFWGIPEDFIALFKKYAEAPLRMSPTPGENVRTRKRGIPITDAFETLFGETVLFCMDVAVNRLSKATLIRFHDDLFLHGEPSETASAWEVIKDFVQLLGLDINASKTGSVVCLTDQTKDSGLVNRFPKGPVCIGMLQLSDTGDWTIDQDQVAAHTRQLQKQLGQCNSIMQFQSTWNACMGRFFQNTFGTPANCFGKAHIDAILETHAKMQKRLFEADGGSITTYLRRQIRARFGVEDVPDSFFFLPEEFGGLGLKNPFIPFLVLKNRVYEDPQSRMTEFCKEERRIYKEASEAYAALSASDRKRWFKKCFTEGTQEESILKEPFFSFEEFCAHREEHSRDLRRAFEELMCKPRVSDIKLAKEVEPWFEELTHTHGQSWNTMSSETKWTMNLYAEELKQRFGALSIVDKNLLPSGVMKMLKKKKVTWQLVIWE
jgi:hypothetical protein